MCQRAAHESNIQQTDHTDVGHVFAAPTQKAIILLALQPAPYALRAGFARSRDAKGACRGVGSKRPANPS